MRRLSLIVAVSRDGVIGKDGGLPWRIPEDLRHFKATTQGHAVIMGRRTWDEVGRPLPGRRNIVVTTTRSEIPGAEVVKTLEAALALAADDPEPFVIGGAGLYAAALPLATDLYLTEVDRTVDGDTYFPPFDRTEWVETERRPGEEAGVTFVKLRRRPPPA